MLLADDYFLLAHDDRQGKARLSPRAVELGLAGALIGELVLEQHLFVEGPLLRVVRPDPPSDPLAHTTLATMLAEPEHRAVRTWLAYLGQTAVESVAQRLVRANLVRPVSSRRLLKTVTRYPPHDINLQAGRIVRLRRLLTGVEPVQLADGALMGLAEATGLTRHLLWDSDAATLKRMHRLVRALPPQLHDLIVQVEAAVGDAVLSQRG
jgi:hypothetical protein